MKKKLYLSKRNIEDISSLLLMLCLNFGTIYTISLGTKKFNFSYSEFFLYIFLLCFIFNKKLKIYFKLNNYILFKFIFVIYIIFVNFWADSISANLSINYYFIVGLISYVFFLNIFIQTDSLYSKGLRIFGLALSLSIIFIFLYNIIFVYNLFDVRFYELKKSISVPLGSSNFLALFLNFMFFYEIISKKKHWSGYSFIYILALLFTLSRGGYIAFFIGIFLLILFNIILMNNYKLGFIFLFVFIISSLIIFYLSNNFFDLTTFSSVFTRLEIWRDRINLFLQNPIFGSGYQYENITNSHNIILTLLSSYGIVGFLLCMVYFGNLILLSFKYYMKKFSYNSLKFLVPLLVVFIHSLIEPFFLSAESQIFMSAFYANLYKELILLNRK